MKDEPQDLNQFFEAIAKARRNDDGTASALGELIKLMPDFSYALWCEQNRRRQNEWGK